MNLIILTLLIFSYGLLSWIFRITRAFVWLKKEREKDLNGSEKPIFLIIPVLHEEKIVESTAKYYTDTFLEKRKNTFLAFVTTEKENTTNFSNVNTIECVKKVALQNSKILHIHYPYVSGKMAHQINYAVSELEKRRSIQNETLLGIYNADSRPEKMTLSWLDGHFNVNRKVFQQYGCYLGNRIPLGTLSEAVTAIAARWQTRWAIGFEIEHALRQFSRFKILPSFNYCIGHGLFMSFDMYKKVGGFSEVMHNEDAIIGLQLSEAKEYIHPIPFFDVSFTPDSVEVLFTQQTNWSLGPLQSFEYATLLSRGKMMKQKLSFFYLSTKLFTHAVYWIFGPSLICVALCTSFFIGRLDLALHLFILIFLFIVVPNAYSAYIVNYFKTVAVERQFKVFLLIAPFLFYFIHGLGALRGSFRYFKYLLFGREMVKEKTKTAI